VPSRCALPKVNAVHTHPKPSSPLPTPETLIENKQFASPGQSPPWQFPLKRPGHFLSTSVTSSVGLEFRENVNRTARVVVLRSIVLLHNFYWQLAGPADWVLSHWNRYAVFKGGLEFYSL